MIPIAMINPAQPSAAATLFDLTDSASLYEVSERKMCVKRISAKTPTAQKTIVGTIEPPSPLSAPATIWLEAKKIAPSMIPAERLPAVICSRRGAPAHPLLCHQVTPAPAELMLCRSDSAVVPTPAMQALAERDTGGARGWEVRSEVTLVRIRGTHDY